MPSNQILSCISEIQFEDQIRCRRAVDVIQINLTNQIDERRCKFITKTHADLVFKACISFLRCFRTPGAPIRSGPGKPNQRKVSSWTFRRGIPEQKFNVNRACFPKEKHQNSLNFGRNSWTFRFGPFFGLVCRGESWSNKDNPSIFWNATLSFPFMVSNHANSYLVPISFWMLTLPWIFYLSRLTGLHLVL